MEKVAIIGLGYVGLPLACLCAEKGFLVRGLDTDQEKVALINEGKSPIKDGQLEKKLSSLKGRIRASTEPKQALEGVDIAIVCVPTPAVGSKPDLGFVEEACKSLAGFLGKGELVLIESTVYPGTVEEIVRPLLETGSGLKAGKGFFLGHCPERIDPGNASFPIEKIPRVLSCISPEGLEKAKRFYSSIIDAEIIALGSVKSAEAVKVVENTFRDVNIAFVNELAKSFDKMGIDIVEVIRGASSKPFGFMPFFPGPGVGGHCISQDPYYLIARAQQAGFKPSFLSLAREINNAMPEYVASVVEAELKQLGIGLKSAKIAALGVSYKPDVDDARESPALKVAALLREKNASLKVFDPFLPRHSNVSSLVEAVKGSDCILLLTHHSEFVKELSPEFIKGTGARLVVDARNALDKQGILKEGLRYKGVGR